MSNSVSFVQPAPVAEVHSVAPEQGVLAETLLRMAAIMNQAHDNVGDAQTHLGRFRRTGDRSELYLFIADWGQLDFGLFWELLAEMRIVFRVQGPHTVDEQWQILVAVRNQLRAAVQTGETRAGAHAPEIATFVAWVAANAENTEVQRLVQEIYADLTRLEGLHTDEGQRHFSPSDLFFGRSAGLDSSDSSANAKLTRTMLADAQKLTQKREDEQQKRALEDSREMDFRHGHAQEVKARMDKAVALEKEIAAKTIFAQR
jgi:hypothetical protein